MFRRPIYPDQSDYNTNAPSYYDDLARKQKMLKILVEKIYHYDKELAKKFEEIAKRFEEWDKNLEQFPDEVVKLLEKWLKDGTLSDIVNRVIFEELNDKINRVEGHAVSVKYYGAKGDGKTDDTGAFKQALEDANGRKLYVPAGRYKINSELKVSVPVNIDGDGDQSIIDFSSGGNFIAQNEVEKFPSLSSDIRPGRTSIAFSRPVDIRQGDVLIAHNNTPYSFASFRPYYKDGCMFQVDQIISGNVVSMFGVSPSTYRYTDMDMYRLKEKKFHAKNLAFKGNRGKSRQFMVSGYVGVKIENLYVDDATGDTFLGFDRCYDLDISDIHGGVYSGNSYPVVIANCQNVLVDRIKAKSSRHCIAIGGGDEPGSVPSRFISVSKCNLNNRSANGIGAGDVHGIGVDVTYTDCTMNTSFNMAGKNIRIMNSTIIGRDVETNPDGNCIFGSEVLGGKYEIKNCSFETAGDGQLFGAFVNLGIQNIKEDLTIEIKDCSFSGFGQDIHRAFDFHVGDTGTLAHNVNIVIDGITKTNIGKILQIASVRGLRDPNNKLSVTIENVGFKVEGVYYTAGASSFYDKTRLNLPVITGQVKIKTIPTVGIAYGTPFTIEPFYGKAPMAFAVSVQESAEAIDGVVGVDAFITSINSTHLRIGIKSRNAQPWTVEKEFTVKYMIVQKDR